jgi:peptide deformylase
MAANSRLLDARRLSSLAAALTIPTPLPESGMHLRRVLVRPVLEHPDPVLARPCEEVDPCHPRIVALAHILSATMRVSPACVGLAAPQIGESVRVFAMNVTGHKKAKSCAGLVTLVNPQIIMRAGNIVMREGCTSVPHLTGDVARASEVIVEGYEPGTGRRLLFATDAIEARCVQHEVDHLDGILFVDRVLDPVAELFARKRYV